MEILAQTIKNGRLYVYYQCDGAEMQGYIYHMSRPMDSAEFTFHGWLCSGPAWSRTFKKSLTEMV